ncbi:MAG: hypothetical protein JO199_09180 [Candidatus Eremiobacteraeota bacterium]|nr:hypothetical protein [Candidatus Eremiobacteraeota bacterium]
MRVAGAAAMTPPPDGATYYYQFSIQHVATATATPNTFGTSTPPPPTPAPIQTGVATMKWSARGNGSYGVSVTTSGVLGQYPWKNTIPPFVQPGNYQFASSSGSLIESYGGYGYQVTGPGWSDSQRMTNVGGKVIARFPLAVGDSYSAAVAVHEGSGQYNRAARLHFHAKAAAASDGSYSLSWFSETSPIQDRNTRKASLATDGSGFDKLCRNTTVKDHCSTRSFGLPIMQGSTYVIPVTVVDSSGAKVKRFVPDWYPGSTVPSPLMTDTVTVGHRMMSSLCGSYAGQTSIATIETIGALDPVDGTVTNVRSTAYYQSGKIMPACGVSTTTVEYYDNVKSGKLKRTEQTTDVVVMTSAP